MGPPLGDSVVRDPVLEMRERQLRWWQVVANIPGLVGTVHRLVAWQQDEWQEPTLAMASALRAVGWRARRNESCLRAAAWPVVAPERSYPGEVVLQPVDWFALPGAVYTDGSVSRAGGAAAVQMDEEAVRTARVSAPRSSTQCELVALALAMDLRPPHVLTDSLAALHLLQSWGTWSPQRNLQTADRVLVRQVIHLAGRLASPPLLEKVKAHDDAAIALGYPKAVGNDTADRWAKRAATEAGHAHWPDAGALYGDPVILEDAGGIPVWDARQILAAAWWDRRQRSTARARPLLERLYPPDVLVDWVASSGVFHHPIVQGDAFVHTVAPAVTKWLARVRTGCLSTQMRLVCHGLAMGPVVCLCCGASNEDDEHLLTGCVATGAADWLASILEVWRATATALHVVMPDPPAAWLEDHRFMLVAALLPAHLAADCGIPEAVAPRFLALLHRALAGATAERLRRREELHALVAAGASGSQQLARLGSDQPTELARSSLPAERRLTVQDLRRVEHARRGAQQPPALPSPSSVAPVVVPAAGVARRRWLRQRLVSIVQEEMDVCPQAEGVEAVVVLELFERVTGEAFTDTPGTLVGQRVRALAKVLGNVAQEAVFDPPLTQAQRRALTIWNRRPRVAVDVGAWRRQTESVEARAPPVPRLRGQMAAVDAGLAAWICGHHYLVPTALATGESGMALVILWEVDHQRSFPTQGGEGLSAALVGFTRRLLQRVVRDPRLSWLESEDMALPLAPGLAPTHHRRWAVRVAAPAPEEPQGWYTDFVDRWRAYLEALVCPPGSRPMSVVSSEHLARVRPAVLRPPPAIPVGGPDVASSSSSVAAAGSPVDAGAAPPPTAVGRPPPRKRRPTTAAAAPAGPPGRHPPTAERRPQKQRGPPPRPAAPPGPDPCAEASLGSAAASPPSPARPTQHHTRQREEVAPPGPPSQRQRTLLAWVRPHAPQLEEAAVHVERATPRHGRAAEGPPT